MTTLLAYVYKKTICYITFWSLEENVGSFSGDLWVAHGAANLPVTNEELLLCFSVLLNHFWIDFLIEIVVQI